MPDILKETPVPMSIAPHPPPQLLAATGLLPVALIGLFGTFHVNRIIQQ